MASFKATTGLEHLVAKPEEWHVVGAQCHRRVCMAQLVQLVLTPVGMAVFLVLHLFSGSLSLLLEK